ncbi:MAG: hypothetical protein A3G27_14275 [Betaproteobacteria bacterium RIFCSPLOWO2_12_FULL_66_14]|nr:MAG: hypothetical protein A3G27_14275 [Betaproteobacteria bacterium RIFCSPLOWO2_12_FULL_66_14]
MTDDRRRRGGLDRNRIDVQKKHELRFWTEELQIDEATLREVVARVGTRADTVRRHIEQLRSPQTGRPPRPPRPSSGPKN